MLIVFTRFPTPGQTKTRLIPTLGEAGAAELQRMLSDYTFKTCCDLANKRPLAIEVHYEGGNRADVKKWIPAVMQGKPQCQGSLGERLIHAFTRGFNAGMERVIIIGADCPFVTSEIFSQGYDLLLANDLVIGPANDGGCYLIGLSKPLYFLWQNIDWGTDKVLCQIIEISRNHGVTLSYLQPLSDIDRPEDLHNLYDPRSGFCLFWSRK